MLPALRQLLLLRLAVLMSCARMSCLSCCGVRLCLWTPGASAWTGPTTSLTSLGHWQQRQLLLLQQPRQHSLQPQLLPLPVLAQGCLCSNTVSTCSRAHRSSRMTRRVSSNSRCWC